MVQSAYFIIADITGYTYFLTKSELDHAQGVLKSLFKVLLDNIKPPIIISNFQGDAVLSYAPTSVFPDGSNLLDAIEQIYCAFSELLERMKINTTCTCKACVNIQNLDLKFFIHHGKYGLQELQGRQELSGPDVILVHRLMKNSVVEKTKVEAYALITQQAIDALRLNEAVAKMIPYREIYEHLGKVDCFVHNLHLVWQSERKRRQVKLSDEETVFKASVDIPLPQTLAWQFINRPDIKAIYQGANSVSIKKRVAGRTGVGTEYHCVHSDRTVDQFILEWRPPEYFTLREEVHQGPLTLDVTSCFSLSPIDYGTRMEFRMNEAHASNWFTNVISKIIWHLIIKHIFRKQYGPQLALKFKERIEADREAGLIVETPESSISDEQIVASIQTKLIKT